MAECTPLLLGLSGPELTPEEVELFRRLRPAGYVLLARNVVSPQQTRRLTDGLRQFSTDLPIIAIGYECEFFALHNIIPTLPSAASLAARKDLRKIADLAVCSSEMIRMLGCNMVLGPVLDLECLDLSNPACWGSDSQRVIDYAGQWNRWLRKRYVTSCARHFPGENGDLADHGATFSTCPATLAQLQQKHVLPYTALMPELDAIMVNHVSYSNIDPDVPASLSRKIVQSFLRDQLGFDRHLIVTDALDHIASYQPPDQAAARAMAAGNDLAMILHRSDLAAAAAEKIASLPYSATYESLERIEKFRYKKLHRPHEWTDAKWSSNCASIEKIATEISEMIG